MRVAYTTKTKIEREVKVTITAEEIIEILNKKGLNVGNDVAIYTEDEDGDRGSYIKCAGEVDGSLIVHFNGGYEENVNHDNLPDD